MREQRMVRRRGDISVQFVVMAIFVLLLLLALLWALGLIGDKSFSLLDTIAEWFAW